MLSRKDLVTSPSEEILDVHFRALKTFLSLVLNERLKRRVCTDRKISALPLRMSNDCGEIDRSSVELASTA